MSTNKPKSLSELLTSQNSELGHIAEQARLREDLSDYLRSKLPAELAGGFMHCSLQDGSTLIVVAANPEWASRLRFESNAFIEACRGQGMEINAVKVRVSSN
jgi:hypothetical protein